MSEFLVHIDLNRPAGMDDSQWGAVLKREAQHAGRYRDDGVIERMWRIPGTTANVGIWSADTATELHELLSTLPAFPHMKVVVQPLAQHYLEA
ncbi:MAG: muconolactone Delta-isomerase family protein [Mycobacterium sp.]